MLRSSGMCRTHPYLFSRLRPRADPEMLEQILPAEVAVVEEFRDVPDARLFPGEEAVIARAVSKRRLEFATARACARAALARLGEPPAPILPGLRGAPQWPKAVAGSITHCEGYRAAAVARMTDVATIGLDAEPNQPLPDGVLDVIALDREQAQVAGLFASDPGVARWDRLLFCAKESEPFSSWSWRFRRVLNSCHGPVAARRVASGDGEAPGR
jgi:4'-phosphopantetheinyl transferase EntD